VEEAMMHLSSHLMLRCGTSWQSFIYDEQEIQNAVLLAIHKKMFNRFRITFPTRSYQQTVRKSLTYPYCLEATYFFEATKKISTETRAQAVAHTAAAQPTKGPLHEQWSNSIVMVMGFCWHTM